MVHIKFLFLLITIKQLSNAMPQKLLLTVYYESKCPDSKSFILKQLEPTMQHLREYVQLKFVPFGKSRSLNYGDGGFECQHGPAECLGNIVQDCSLHLLNNKSDKKKLAYVTCEMDTEAGSQGRFDCVEKANLSSAEVEHCVVSGKGTILQLESEYYTNLATDLVKPKFVPTVTVNGIIIYLRAKFHPDPVQQSQSITNIQTSIHTSKLRIYNIKLDIFDQEFQDKAQTDLFGACCPIIPEAPPCARYYNYLALNHLMHSHQPVYVQ